MAPSRFLREATGNEPPSHRAIRFPEDESRHPRHSVEWWYWNGHLKDARGNQYSFMDCLFRVDAKKAKIPALARTPLRTAYFSHSLLTDIARKKVSRRIAPVSIVSDDSFSRLPLYINYFNPTLAGGYLHCAMEKSGTGRYHVKDEDADLWLSPVKKPLLEGGSGYLDLGTKATYYYSLPRLRAEGSIRTGTSWTDVSGIAWMDHQWADTEYSRDRWDWCSLQLDDGTDMVCCSYGTPGTPYCFASISRPNGRQEHVRDVRIVPIPGRTWTSAKSKAEYPVAWRITIPGKDITLSVAAPVRDQEMLFGAINYWEGPLTVQGRIGRRAAKGVGFMELVGYPSQYSNTKYVSDELGRVVGMFASAAKKQALRWAKGR